MKHETIATAWHQVAAIVALMSAPVGVAAWMLMDAPPSRANPGMMIVAMTVLLIVTVLGAMVTRRSIDLSPETLAVRHSYYSFKVVRRDVTEVEVVQLASSADLRLALKTNGVAAFGYLSGWFRRGTGERVFCAISAKPVYLVTFTSTRLDCNQLAVSCSAEMAESLRRWVQ